ncbi:hypothetical protein [Rhodococcus qingshengii]|nr:hypothetical protein [Rhodococcus qingshengii]
MESLPAISWVGAPLRRYAELVYLQVTEIFVLGVAILYALLKALHRAFTN